MPLAASYPFGNRNVAAGGVTYAVPPAKPLGSTITSGIGDIVNLFGTMGQQGVRRAQTDLYGAEAERARAEAGKFTSEGDAKAAGIARQQRKDDALAEGDRTYQDVIKRGGSPVEAAQARQLIVAPYMADEFAAQGLTTGLTTDAMLTGVDPTGTGQTTPIMRAARNVAAGGLAIGGHALQGPEGTTQLTYDDNQAALAADEQRQRDKANQESGDRRYATGVESGDRRYGVDVGADTSRANNRATIYGDAYNKSLHDARLAGGDPRLPGGGVPVTKDADKTQVIYDRNNKPLRRIETTSGSRARFGQGPQAPGLPPGNYPPGPAGPSLQGAPAPAPAKPTPEAAYSEARAAAPHATPEQKAKIAARLRQWGYDPARAGL